MRQCKMCNKTLEPRKQIFCSRKCEQKSRRMRVRSEKNKEAYHQYTNDELDNYIASYCPNLAIPRHRSSKFIIVQEIDFLKRKLPIQIPHPEKENEYLVISLDTFMQGEKL